MKALTVRMDDDDALVLEAAARTDGVPIAEMVRLGVAELVALRRCDSDWRQRHDRLVRALKNLKSAQPLTVPTPPTEGSR